MGVAYGEAPGTYENTNEGYMLVTMSGVFAPFIGMCSSPFIALTVLSGAGSLLNSGIIDASSIPFSETLIQLPISNITVFVIFLIITITKFLLGTNSVTELFNQATLGRIEDILGIVCTVGGAFLITSTVTAYASEVVIEESGGGFFAFMLTLFLTFFLAAAAYIIFIVIKTMIAAIDGLIFLASLVLPPGATAFLNGIKNFVIIGYTIFSITNPVAASIIGLFWLLIAFLIFRKAKRLETYYRRIYIYPFFNSVFRRNREVPLMPKKLPRGVRKEFPLAEICIEGFFMNKVSKLYKREFCYFINSQGRNYIFKKRFIGKAIKIEIQSDAFLETKFRFTQIFTDDFLPDKQKNIFIIFSREQKKNFSEIIDKTGLIDYNAILEERKRIMLQERTEKIQQMKDNASEKINSLGSLFRRKSKIEGI
jgi:hypothetical protein